MQASRSQPPQISPASVARALRAGAVVIDGRTAEAFDAGHVAGAVNIPAGGEDGAALAMRLLSPDVPLIAVATWRTQATWWPTSSAVPGSGGCWARWTARTPTGHSKGRPRRRSGAVSVDRLAEELATGGVLLLDVRDDHEWRAGHVPCSAHRSSACARPPICCLPFPS
jgi:hydroxyacylglutathione hydrolase